MAESRLRVSNSNCGTSAYWLHQETSELSSADHDHEISREDLRSLYAGNSVYHVFCAEVYAND